MKCALKMACGVLAVFSCETAWANPSIDVQSPWMRASMPGSSMSAAYMSIVNKAAVADKLISVSSPVASTAEIHLTSMENGSMRMKRMNELELAPGKPVELAAGGLHVMLFGVRRTLCVGERVPLTLTFAKSAPRTIEAEVRAPNMDHQAPCKPMAVDGTQDHTTSH